MDSVSDDDHVFENINQLCKNHISETYSDDSFSTLIFNSIQTILDYKKCLKRLNPFLT